MKSIKTLIVLVILSLTIFMPTIIGTQRVLNGIDLSNNLYSNLELASSFQNPNDIEPLLDKSIHFLENHNLTEGNTCAIYKNNPKCDLSNFYSKLQQDRELLQAVEEEPIGSVETSNALMSIHRSLWQHTEEGESLRSPDLGFFMTWGSHAMLGKTLELISITLVLFGWLSLLLLFI